MKEETKQTMWETWFILSLSSIIVLFIIGTMKDSRIIFPNWPYFAIAVLFNILVCIKIGTYLPKDTKRKDPNK